MSDKKKPYEVADKAWQPVLGCDPAMPCAPRCWARKTVARIVECQRGTSPERAEFYSIALTDDGKRWSGQTYLDREHLNDPLSWKKSARVATGFHGDWGRLSRGNQLLILDVMAHCPWHDFMPLTKCPDNIADFFTRWSDTKEADYKPKLARGPEATRAAHTCGRALLFADMLDEMGSPPSGCAYPTYDWMNGMCYWPSVFRNITIGCSVMNQTEADRQREAMQAISRLGWRTHVWYEPALGPVDWTGWEHIEQLIMGGESNSGRLFGRSCEIGWFRNSIEWCRRNRIAPFIKQFGSHAIDARALCLRDRKGAEPSEWPVDLRVREYPEAKR